MSVRPDAGDRRPRRRRCPIAALLLLLAALTSCAVGSAPPSAATGPAAPPTDRPPASVAIASPAAPTATIPPTARPVTPAPTTLPIAPLAATSAPAPSSNSSAAAATAPAPPPPIRPTAAPATRGTTTPAGGAPTTPVAPRPPYVDDRSTPERLVSSYYSAIARQEYARAYSYWEAGGPSGRRPEVTQLAHDYADLVSVRLEVGTITGDVGAGQLYYSVPVGVEATTTGRAQRAWSACYTLHLARPQFQAVPPFRPMAIQSEELRAADASTGTTPRAAATCGPPGGNPMLPGIGGGDPADLGPSRYLDDRGDPESLLRSLVNAINRQEYVRAYSYWEPGQTATFAQFAEGYARTASVGLRTGSVVAGDTDSELGFALPATLVARTTDGATQIFVGCYRGGRPRPELQVGSPFRPLAIRSGRVREVPRESDATAAMPGACAAG